jgi:flagellar basal body rod protein FlgF
VNSLNRFQPQVFDAADNPLQGNFYVSNQDRQGEEAYTQTYTLQVYAQNPNAGEPHHVRFELPSETREVRVPFEFKDVLLP